MLNLNFGHRKVLPHTHPRSTSESQQMFVPLYLRPSLSSSSIMIQIQPSFRVKLTRVRSPQDLGRVDANDRNADGSAFGDKDTVDELAGGGANGVSEWNGVFDMDLRNGW